MDIRWLIALAPRTDREPGRAKRAPVDWRRYAAEVRRARRRLPRYEHPLVVRVAVSVLFAVAGASLLQAFGVGVSSSLRDLGAGVAGTLPKAQEAQLVLGETPVTISAAPVLVGLPDFTRTNEVRIAGKVPDFAVRPGRQIALTVNGRLVATYVIGADGRFGGGPITLPDGPSTITATLVEGQAEIAATSGTVVVDRVPPALEVTRPRANDTVDGPDVIVEGKTEAGADVSVNDRAVRPNPDGTFTERVAAPVGPLVLTIVARDKAGNETKTQLSITVRQPAQTPTAGTVLAVTLDRTKVRPGETVVAKVTATQDGRPRADLAVTLQVGVITIGTYKTDLAGTASIGFAAPNHEVDDVAVVILGGGASARATLTVSAK